MPLTFLTILDLIIILKMIHFIQCLYYLDFSCPDWIHISFWISCSMFFNYVFLLKILRSIITLLSRNSFPIQCLSYNGNKFAFGNFLVLLSSKMTLQFSFKRRYNDSSFFVFLYFETRAPTRDRRNYRVHQFRIRSSSSNGIDCISSGVGMSIHWSIMRLKLHNYKRMKYM